MIIWNKSNSAMHSQTDRQEHWGGAQHGQPLTHPAKVTVDFPAGHPRVQAVPVSRLHQPCHPSWKCTAWSQGALAERMCDSAHVYQASWEKQWQDSSGSTVSSVNEEVPESSHTRPPKNGLSSQPGKCKNWQGQCSVSPGLIAGRTAKENQSQARAVRNLSTDNLAVSSQVWAEVPLSQARILVLEWYSFL